MSRGSPVSASASISPSAVGNVREEESSTTTCERFVLTLSELNGRVRSNCYLRFRTWGGGCSMASSRRHCSRRRSSC